jgi:endonuclease III
MAAELCEPVVVGAPTSNDTVVVTTTSLLGSILNWLRAGYPEGVPGPDRVPLLALLRATPLTDEQIKEVVRNITADGSTATADGSIDTDEIAAFIKDVSHHDAGQENVQRVAAKLAAAGWPLAGVSDTPSE